MVASRLGLALGIVALGAIWAGAAPAAPTETTLFDLAGGTSAAYPNGPLVLGASGELYGVSRLGGAADHGTVFVLNPPSGARKKWTLAVLYSFSGDTDGDQPTGGLISDANGVLYGTTGIGGAGGAGTVFSLAPPVRKGGAWTLTTLHAFGAGTDGAFPAEDAGLVMDSAGALYGTTINGGARNGTVFRLAPPAPGTTAWTETILHAFTGGKDGYFPEGGLLPGADGVLYGTTSGGGATFTCPGGCGTAFTLTPPAAGKTRWTHKVIHSFVAAQGAHPYGSLIADAAGDLYGVTELGGGSSACSLGCGAIYRLAPPTVAVPRWTGQTLHAFTSGADSEFPVSALWQGSDGTLWGTASGATPNRGGATFSLAPPTGGGTTWSETIVHTFPVQTSDGASPQAGLTAGPGGVLYGVTSEGGGDNGVCGAGCGTLFQIVP